MEWKSTEEYPLGEIHNNGHFTLKPDYEETRLFAFPLKDGASWYLVGSMREGDGAVVDDDGDDTGFTWDCISHYAEINSPNKQLS